MDAEAQYKLPALLTGVMAGMLPEGIWASSDGPIYVYKDCIATDYAEYNLNELFRYAPDYNKPKEH